jgi:hypothetical protein
VPEIAAPRASYAVAFNRGDEKIAIAAFVEARVAEGKNMSNPFISERDFAFGS